MNEDQIRQACQMDDDTLDRQLTLETIGDLRAINQMSGRYRPEFESFAAIINSYCMAVYEGLPHFEAVKRESQLMIDTLDRLRASVSQFCEVAESKLDHEGLIPLPEDPTFGEAEDRRKLFRQIAHERCDDGSE